MTLLNSDTSVLICGILVAVVALALDRLLTKRGTVRIVRHFVPASLNKGDSCFAVVVEYSATSSSVPYSHIKGKLIDKAAPTTVVESKLRSLSLKSQFTRNKVNHCQEFLYFPALPILASGDEDWELQIEVVTVGCLINPFYKIFPIKSRLSGDVKIKQPKGNKKHGKRH